MAKGTTIKSHINKFITLNNDLKIVYAKLEDQDHAMMLLCLLAPSYKNFRGTLIYERTFLTFNDVKDNLLSKEKQHRDFKSTRRSNEQDLNLLLRGQIKVQGKADLDPSG